MNLVIDVFAVTILIDGEETIVFKPVFNSNIKRLEKLKRNWIYTMSITSPRENRSNDSLHACIDFFLYNAPRKYSKTFASHDLCFESLKLEVDFAKPIKLGKKLYKIPRRSNFIDLPDENEYIDLCAHPIKDWIAEAMGFVNRYDLTQASIESKEISI